MAGFAIDCARPAAEALLRAVAHEHGHPPSFNLDEVMRKMTETQMDGNK